MQLLFRCLIMMMTSAEELRQVAELISEKMEEVKRLKEYIFLILNKKYEQEWKKQKFEVGDKTYKRQ